VSAWLVDFLTRPIRNFDPPACYSASQLRAALRPGDVLLVEGNLRISSLIKYITQSMWSHVALYVGPQAGAQSDDPAVLVEAEIGQGVVLSPLSKYAGFHTRICRPTGLRADDRERVVAHALGRLGNTYDLKHVIDLARHQLAPPTFTAAVQSGLRRLGSGEPTRVICSTLIAQAFQSVRFPILPTHRTAPGAQTRPEQSDSGVAQVWEARHSSLFAPRDFDVSPYFSIVKPAPVEDFDYTRARWAA
jgi:hypothetical protein